MEMIIKAEPSCKKSFITYIEDIEELAMQSISAYQGVLSTWTMDYLGVLPNYQEKTIKALCHGFMDLETQSDEEKTWLDRVLICTMVWLMPIVDKYIPMVINRVWIELKLVEEGYSKVSNNNKKCIKRDLLIKIRLQVGLRGSLI
jgi:hypothetical protein